MIGKHKSSFSFPYIGSGITGDDEFNADLIALCVDIKGRHAKLWINGRKLIRVQNLCEVTHKNASLTRWSCCLIARHPLPSAPSAPGARRQSAIISPFYEAELNRHGSGTPERHREFSSGPAPT